MSLEELGDFDGALEDIVFHILSTQVQFHLPIIGIVSHSDTIQIICVCANIPTWISVHIFITAVNILKILGS